MDDSGRGNSEREDGRGADRPPGADACSRLKRAEEANRLGRHEEAERHARAVLSEDPRSPAAFFALGVSLERQGRFAAAVAAFEDGCRLEPEAADFHFHLRLNRLRLARLRAAEEACRGAAAQDPESARAWFCRGLFEAARQRFDDAIRAFESAIERDARQADAWLELGNAWMWLGKTEEAIRAYRRGIDLDCEFAPAHSALAHALSLLDWRGEAAACDRRALEIMSKPQPRPPVPVEISADPRYPFRARTRPSGGRMARALPVVFIHRDLHVDRFSATPIAYSLAQAKKSNPDSEVVLIGDATNRYGYVAHDKMLNHFEGAARFGALYRHVTRRVRYSYLLFCFQRWFVLREYMESAGLEQCMHVDSDVMLYANATREAERFGDFDFQLSADPNFAVSGHCIYVGNPSALREFCDFMTDLFERPPKPGDPPCALRQAIWGEASDLYLTDMAVFEAFRSTGRRRFGNLSEVVDDAIYDANIASGDGFQMEGGLKRIEWRDGRPYGRLQGNGRRIRFKALHFNGPTKDLMKTAFLQRPLWRGTGSGEAGAGASGGAAGAVGR